MRRRLAVKRKPVWKLSFFGLTAIFLCAILFTASVSLFSIDLFGKQELQDRGFTAKELKTLEESLSRVSFLNRTVLLTTLNKSWAENNTMIDIFLSSFRAGHQTSHLLNHLLIVNLDRAAYKRCIHVHPHCYKLVTRGVDFSGEKFFMSADYIKMMWRRVDFLRVVLELGYNFVFTDADIMWLRDPFRHFSPVADMEIACDEFNGREFDLNNFPNGGFVHAVSNDRTIAFYKLWYKARLRYPNHHDQDVFNDIKHTSSFARLKLKVRFLDTRYFAGFCQVIGDFDRICTMHANCCTKLERKLHDLRLVLQDWKRYLEMTSEEQGEKRLAWRAPKECLKSFELDSSLPGFVRTILDKFSSFLNEFLYAHS